MSGPVLNVAVIGCGEVAQCVHVNCFISPSLAAIHYPSDVTCLQLPNLLIASHMFKTTVICGISPSCLALCGERFHIRERRTIHRPCGLSLTLPLRFNMLSSPIPIDLVFILTADQLHAEHVILSA